VTLPRLRDRSDFDTIARHLLRTIDPDREITASALARLCSRPWPGNIRELRNMLARLTLDVAGGLIDETSVDTAGSQPPAPVTGSLHDIQHAQILTVYTETGRNISETARRLGVSRNTIYRALGRNIPK
jgi:transcriptional regulator of acetoin/glycerol metabolism